MSELFTSHADGVTQLTFNRPEKKNAINKAMYIALNGALKDAADDFSVRAVVLTGAGGIFTAGNDIFDFANDIPADDSAPGFQFIKALHNFPKPLIAAVEGNAVGIGTTMLLHCDAAFAAPDAKFRMPFVNLGVVPEAGSTYLFPRLVGHIRASEILLTGRVFSGTEAAEIGLVNKAINNPLESAMATAKLIAQQPPNSVINTKALIKSAHHDAVTAVMNAEGELFRLALQSEEAQTAFMNFLSGGNK